MVLAQRANEASGSGQLRQMIEELQLGLRRRCIRPRLCTPQLSQGSISTLVERREIANERAGYESQPPQIHEVDAELVRLELARPALLSGISCDEELVARDIEHVVSYVELVAKALWFIERHYAADISLDDIAHTCAVSKYHLSRIFGDAAHVPIVKYVRGRRLT